MYAVEFGSAAIIHIPSCIKSGSGTQKLIGGKGYTDTGTHTGSILHKPASGK